MASGFLTQKPKLRYVYRYLDDKQHVHYITKVPRATPKLFHKQQIYSAPYYHRYEGQLKNVLWTFANEQLCMFEHEKLLRSSKENDMDMDMGITITSSTLQECKEYSHLLYMPLVVVINQYCDTDEKEECIDVFYHQARQENEEKIYMNINKK